MIKKIDFFVNALFAEIEEREPRYQRIGVVVDKTELQFAFFIEDAELDSSGMVE